MKKKNRELNLIFSVAEEMVKNNGEDHFYYDIKNNNFIIAALDGCGGSGSKKYENYSGKTGAYIASRAVCGGIKSWFCQSHTGTELPQFIHEALSVCTHYADKTGRILGTLGKAFPTTAALISGSWDADKISVNCFWAGDSRCYMLNSNGLHQLTKDDLDDEDAMSNLTNDGVMTNVINASTAFELHSKTLVLKEPCILLTATDGCFGYLNSPMEFEYLLVDSLVKSRNVFEWKIALNERMHSIAGDDYTLCVAGYGFDDFEEIRHVFAKRNETLVKNYINPSNDVNTLWEAYKKEYSIYL